MSAGLATPASTARIASLLNGTSSAFRMKPGRSAVRTGVWPAASHQVRAVSKVAWLVSRPGESSISFMSWAGRQKCMPTTRSSRPQPEAISVIESVEVLEAKIVLPGQTPCSALNSLLLGRKVLEHRLDHQIALPEVGELGRLDEVADDLVELRARRACRARPTS